jgi:putative hemolysin
VLRLLGIRGGPSAAVTEEEIAASLEEGLDAGVIEAQEHQMVRNVFRLDDRQIGSMMIPRAEIVWLDANAALDDAAGVMPTTAHALPGVPRRAGRRDRRARRAGLLQPLARGERPAWPSCCSRRCSCPRRCRAWNCWSTSAAPRADLVFVVDEYGAVQGVITERDLLEAITGEFGTSADEDAWAVQRDDGSWLMDGLIPVPELKDRLELKELPEEDRGRYNTLAGMVMLLLGRLPRTTDHGGMGRLALRGRGPRRQARRQGAGHRTVNPGEEP